MIVAIIGIPVLCVLYSVVLFLQIKAARKQVVTVTPEDLSELSTRITALEASTIKLMMPGLGGTRQNSNHAA